MAIFQVCRSKKKKKLGGGEILQRKMEQFVECAGGKGRLEWLSRTLDRSTPCNNMLLLISLSENRNMEAAGIKKHTTVLKEEVKEEVLLASGANVAMKDLFLLSQTASDKQKSPKK